jgi:hypothetical protein
MPCCQSNSHFNPGPSGSRAILRYRLVDETTNAEQDEDYTRTKLRGAMLYSTFWYIMCSRLHYR